MTDTLKKLAQGYARRGGTLYMVGGTVRDALLAKEAKDADLCGSLPPEVAKKTFESAGALVSGKYARLGTLRVSMDGILAEYTSFRTDSYARGHRPESVLFTDSIAEDAARRDFTVGSLYRDIMTGEILDPTGRGLDDLRDKVLRPVRGEQTLREDGLRILRLARFGAVLGFSPAEGAMEAARSNRALLRDIAPARLRDEIKAEQNGEHSAEGAEQNVQ